MQPATNKRTSTLMALAAVLAASGWAAPGCRVRLVDPTPPSDASGSDDEAPPLEGWAHDPTPFPFRMPPQLPPLSDLDAGIPAPVGPAPQAEPEADSPEVDADGGASELTRRRAAAAVARRKQASLKPATVGPDAPSAASSALTTAASASASSTASATHPSTASATPSNVSPGFAP